MTSYVVAGRAPWNRETFDRHLRDLDGDWTFVSTTAELESAVEHSPRYVFFLHWSEIVPAALLDAHECVCFHMAALPYGRGGSPLQNLVVRGHRDTVVSAFRMVEELDAGPVYGTRPLSLDGSAEEIYLRAGRASAELAAWIASEEPSAVPQSGDVVSFRRRTPDQSAMPADADLDAAYDHIRMLDADGYPAAFVDHDGLRYTFRRATRSGGRVEADVVITPIPEP